MVTGVQRTTLALTIEILGLLSISSCTRTSDHSLPYANLDPAVKYVGSQRCAACHQQIFDTYSRSEMGRSFSRLKSEDIVEQFPQTYSVYDSVRDFNYQMIEHDGEFFQREYRRAADGKITNELQVRADYVMGSGNNLRMYLSNEGGMLYELPLTWYVHRQKWDLSPGYRDFGNLRFSRYAGEKCMSCHDSYPELIATAKDRYLEPLPLGIGCERCHGPGELHVRQALGEELKDLSVGTPTIVNPAKLPPQERLDVCRQCHLQGKAWALREMNDWFGFRPGMKLEEHRSVYFPERTLKQVIEVGDSPQRLAMSKCFQNSNGELTCIRCHDPHFSITTFSLDHYNAICSQCHSLASLPGKGTRDPHTNSGNCISCHMNRTGSDNTLHGVSATDHWIRKDANRTVIDWSTLKHPSKISQPVRLIPFVDATDDKAQVRLGMAYLYYFNEQDDRSAYLDSALTYLRSEQKGTDAQTYVKLGEIESFRGEYAKAITSLAKALEIDPDQDIALYLTAQPYASLGRMDSATHYYRSALRQFPDEPTYIEGLGMALARQGDSKRAAFVLEEGLKRDTRSYLTYSTLGNLFALSLGDPRRAVGYYRRSLLLEPDIRETRINLGNAYVLLGEYGSALEEYKAQLQRWPNSPETLVNIGRVFILEGKKQQARDAFRKALKLSPGLEIARLSLEKLEKQ